MSATAAPEHEARVQLEHNPNGAEDALARIGESAAVRRLRAALTRLALMSHAPTVSYEGAMSRSAEGDPGGVRPPGALERPNRRDRHDFDENYRQKPAEWFVWRVNRVRRDVESGRQTTEGALLEVDDLADAAEEAIRAWLKTPDSDGLQPRWGTFEWKCAIADDDRGTTREVATRWGVSHTTVVRYRRQFRGLRNA